MVRFEAFLTLLPFERFYEIFTGDQLIVETLYAIKIEVHVFKRFDIKHISTYPLPPYRGGISVHFTQI
jgi:hypothetical protein